MKELKFCDELMSPGFEMTEARLLLGSLSGYFPSANLATNVKQNERCFFQNNVTEIVICESEINFEVDGVGGLDVPHIHKSQRVADM